MLECIYCCSTWKPEKEHPRAISKGGVRTVVACQACNRSKGDKALMQWFRWLKESPHEKDKYRWRRIKKCNRGRRNEIAQKVHIVENEG